MVLKSLTFHENEPVMNNTHRKRLQPVAGGREVEVSGLRRLLAVDRQKSLEGIQMGTA